MKSLAENLWVLPYSLRLSGGNLGRMVTVIRLGSGELAIHSTGPFTPGDVVAISGLGKPGWLMDVMRRHDTFSKRGREAFPGLPFLAPEGFSMHALMEWDFDRITVGHGEIVETGGKRRLAEALKRAGF